MKQKIKPWTLDIHLWLQYLWISDPANVTTFITSGSSRILSDRGLICEHATAFQVWKVMINKYKHHSILCSVVVHSHQCLENMSFLFHFSVFTQTQTVQYSWWTMKPKTIIPAEKANADWSQSNHIKLFLIILHKAALIGHKVLDIFCLSATGENNNTLLGLYCTIITHFLQIAHNYRLELLF